MLHLAMRAFAPARVPFPIMHVDTGHNFPELIEFRDRTVDAVRRRARRGVACRTRSTPVGSSRTPVRVRAATRCRPSRCSTPSPSTASTPCSAAPAATRSGRGPRSACSAIATSSASGTRRTSGPSCGGSTTAATSAASTCASSRCRTGPSSTSGGSSRSASIELPNLYFAHHREVFRRDGMLMAVNPFIADARRRGAVRRDGALPHDRRRDVHGGRRIGGASRSPTSSPRQPSPGSPSAAPPAPTTGSREAGMEDRKRQGYF